MRNFFLKPKDVVSIRGEHFIPVDSARERHIVSVAFWERLAMEVRDVTGFINVLFNRVVRLDMAEILKDEY